LQEVEEITKKQEKVVAMAGDGYNDALLWPKVTRIANGNGNLMFAIEVP